MGNDDSLTHSLTRYFVRSLVCAPWNDRCPIVPIVVVVQCLVPNVGYEVVWRARRQRGGPISQQHLNGRWEPCVSNPKRTDSTANPATPTTGSARRRHHLLSHVHVAWDNDDRAILLPGGVPTIRIEYGVVCSGFLCECQSHIGSIPFHSIPFHLTYKRRPSMTLVVG